METIILTSGKKGLLIDKEDFRRAYIIKKGVFKTRYIVKVEYSGYKEFCYEFPFNAIESAREFLEHINMEV